MHPTWKRTVKIITRPGRYFSTPGLLLGTLFMAVSLTPTLLPRQDVVQGLISGLSLVAGYGVAVMAHGLWLYLGLPRFRARTRQIIKLVATGLCLLVALIFLWQATEWKNGVRALMDMEAEAGLSFLVIGAVALLVYVGMNSAPTPEERAQLALQELERVGGFERSMLVLVTPTGTGWIDPAAMEPLEYLQLGDIASVSAQYSYLPSPLSLTLEGEYGQEMARALFEVIYEHWTTLPTDDRPDLYLHGLSLGALN